eukprot:scaffold784_cov399-Prasinococcus_capsulatus_cf.AAC.4
MDVHQDRAYHEWIGPIYSRQPFRQETTRYRTHVLPDTVARRVPRTSGQSTRPAATALGPLRCSPGATRRHPMPCRPADGWRLPAPRWRTALVLCKHHPVPPLA